MAHFMKFKDRENGKDFFLNIDLVNTAAELEDEEGKFTTFTFPDGEQLEVQGHVFAEESTFGDKK